MTIEEALSKFKSKHSDLDALSAYEYESCYVFNVASSETADDDLQNLELDTLYGVSKSDGTVWPFNPFDISVEEYDSGKEVSINSESEDAGRIHRWVEIGKSWAQSRNAKND